MNEILLDYYMQADNGYCNYCYEYVTHKRRVAGFCPKCLLLIKVRYHNIEEWNK
jgi:hypothetical protein